eukprot:31042-Pelagococcus_subviridis.AAC.2
MRCCRSAWSSSAIIAAVALSPSSPTPPPTPPEPSPPPSETAPAGGAFWSTSGALFAFFFFFPFSAPVARASDARAPFSAAVAIGVKYARFASSLGGDKSTLARREQQQREVGGDVLHERPKRRAQRRRRAVPPQSQVRKEEHRGRGASRLDDGADERLLLRAAAVGEERRETDRVYRERLELVEQRRAEGDLPAPGRAAQEHPRLARERAVDELERRRRRRRRLGRRGNDAVDVSLRLRLLRIRRRHRAAAAVELLEKLRVVVVVVQVVEVENLPRARADDGPSRSARVRALHVRRRRHRRGRERPPRVIDRLSQRRSEKRRSQRAERARVRLRGAVRRRRDGLHGVSKINPRRDDLPGVDDELIVALVNLRVSPPERVHGSLRAQRFEIRAAVPDAAIRELFEELRRGRFLPRARVNLQNVAARRRVRKRKGELAVEAPGASQRAVDRVHAVRRAQHDDPPSGVEAVHEREQRRDDGVVNLIRL